ncbi:hypothetical protein D3C76_1083000 [compost metagenome]
MKSIENSLDAAIASSNPAVVSWSVSAIRVLPFSLALLTKSLGDNLPSDALE